MKKYIIALLLMLGLMAISAPSAKAGEIYVGGVTSSCGHYESRFETVPVWNPPYITGYDQYNRPYYAPGYYTYTYREVRVWIPEPCYTPRYYYPTPSPRPYYPRTRWSIGFRFGR